MAQHAIGASLYSIFLGLPPMGVNIGLGLDGGTGEGLVFTYQPTTEVSMKVGFTPDEVRAMYPAARAEVADVFNMPSLLNLPLYIDDAGPDEEAIAITVFDDDEGVQTEDAQFILFNERFLPYMYEDEVRYGLLHELAHAAGPFSEEEDGHGPLWQDRVGYLTGFSSPVVAIRNVGQVPIKSVMLETFLNGPVIVDKQYTLGPVYE